MSKRNFLFGKNINTGVNFGHIGDKYEGIKQRVFTDQDYKELINSIQEFEEKYSSRINNSHITIGLSGDKESQIYAEQIYNALVQDNYNIKITSLISSSFDDKNFSVTNAPDNSVLITIFPAPNV